MATDGLINPQNSDVPATSTHVPTPLPMLPEGFSKRKLKKVRNQLEFYFSSSNLSKDKFLQRHMSPRMSQQQQQDLGRGYVELNLITQFVVIRELTGGCLEAVRRAAELSSHLELSEDRRRVRRREPITPLSEEEVTLRTIYIEQIPPPLSSQQALQKFFSKYGAVTYVSLPHYKVKNEVRSKKGLVCKGFAFLEFSSPDAVSKAVSAFQTDLQTPNSEISEAKCAIVNVRTTVKHNTPLVNFGKDLTNKSNKADHNHRKRRNDVEEVEGGSAPICQNVKRNKIDSSISQSSLPSKPSTEEVLRESSLKEISKDVDPLTIVNKKKIRDRNRRKRRPRDKKMLLSNEAKSNKMFGVRHSMKVMTKSEWLDLKSELKSAQKECMSLLKQANKQASLNGSLKPREKQMECQAKEEEKERGCDKILNQSMRVAERIFKY